MPIFQKALVIRKKAFGADHPKVAESLNSIGFCLLPSVQDEEIYEEIYEEAKQKFLKAYQSSKDALGKNHPTTEYYLKNVKLFEGACILY